MPELSVVFYRNMNLGQQLSRSPDRAGLEVALTDAGGGAVRSFQTNGNAVPRYEPARGGRHRRGRAGVGLGVPRRQIIHPRSLLAAILDADPFSGLEDERTYRETFTFFEGGDRRPSRRRGPAPATTLTSSRCDGVALGIIRQRGGSAGSPTSEIERMTGGVATTRTLGPIQRLVRAAERS